MHENQIHLTVAAVIPRGEHFLCVEELIDGQAVINQPAGHVEVGESLVEAVMREAYEETGWRVAPTWFLGITIYRSPHDGITYYRHSFVCEPLVQEVTQPPDPEIQRALWLSFVELQAITTRLRSPMVLQTVVDYRAGRRFPLEIMRDCR